jgi:L-ascorbate metabolism protein UlaG (beta-lactamase superfamily)
MAKVIFHGHACVECHIEAHRVIIDPFLTGNPLADVDQEVIDTHAILLTHGHGDHMGDTVAIAKRTRALVVATFELANYLETKGVTAHAMHIGGSRVFPFGRVKLTFASHGGGVGEEKGIYSTPCGFIYSAGGKSVFHAGDTGLVAEFDLIGRTEKIDVALLPIGDNFTMGPEDAVMAAKMLKPRMVVPVHYNTWEVIEQDPLKFKAMLEGETGIKCIVLSPGGVLEF